MTVTDFLERWRLAENPFRGEEARSDAVFARMATLGSTGSPFIGKLATGKPVNGPMGVSPSDRTRNVSTDLPPVAAGPLAVTTGGTEVGAGFDAIGSASDGTVQRVDGAGLADRVASSGAPVAAGPEVIRTKTYADGGGAEGGGGTAGQPTPLRLFHSDFEKILGDLRRPASSVVFGEKGSGKTAIRMQLAERIDAFNIENPGARLWLIAYDDLNGVLDRLHERLGGKTPLDSLQKMRLVDHLDALLHAVTPRLVDIVLTPGATGVVALGPGERKPVKRLDAGGRRDLLLLQAVYDRPDQAPVRTLQLRRKLRIRPPSGVVWGAVMVSLAPLGVLAAFVWLWFFTPEGLSETNRNYAFMGLGGMYLLLTFKILVWDRLRLMRTSHRVRKQIRVVARRDISYARSLRQVRRSVRENANLPLSDSDESRYAMLERLKRTLRSFGFTGIVVVVDRVDEPTLVRGDPDRMKAVIWPLLNNKFLQQEGIGVKMLLPMELRHAVFRESSTFFQEARLDKQSFIEHLSWTGPMLYDLCESRMAACHIAGSGHPPTALLDLFAEDVTRQDLVDALDRVHQPRDAFKLMYRCLAEHCANVTRGQNEWRIPRHVLSQVVKHESERVQQVFRGIRPG